MQSRVECSGSELALGFEQSAVKQQCACRTLFEALQERALQTALLQVQYRMHPAIAEFSSLQFYSGRIKSGVARSDIRTCSVVRRF